jgi:phospholipase/carboxylesterase
MYAGEAPAITSVYWSKPTGQRAGTPLLVALHGRGSDERSFGDLAAYLPQGPTVAALRAPIPEANGFAWFTNRGIGRPAQESINAVGSAILSWLEENAVGHTAVQVLGFSGGTAMAGSLVLREPARFDAAVLLSGTLPLDAGQPMEPGRLAGMPVFWANDPADAVIPQDLVQASQTWLREESGAVLDERHYPGLGHAISQTELADVNDFLSSVMPEPTAPRPIPVQARYLSPAELPLREGEAPDVTGVNPQQQTSQISPRELQEELYRRALELPSVLPSASQISVPGSRAWRLPTHVLTTDPARTIIGSEFAHLHPDYDGSLHMTLPPSWAQAAVEGGWATYHPWSGTRLSAGMVMVYGPRDVDELDVVWALLEKSHGYATGG